MKEYQEQYDLIFRILKGNGEALPSQKLIQESLGIERKQNYNKFKNSKHFPEKYIIHFCLKYNIFIDSFFRDGFPLRYINDCEVWKPEENFKKKSA